LTITRKTENSDNRRRTSRRRGRIMTTQQRWEETVFKYL